MTIATSSRFYIFKIIIIEGGDSISLSGKKPKMLKWFFCYFGSKRFSSSKFSCSLGYPGTVLPGSHATISHSHIQFRSQPNFSFFFFTVLQMCFRQIWFLTAKISRNPNPIGLGFLWLCTWWVWMGHILLEYWWLRIGRIYLNIKMLMALDRPKISEY